MEHALPFLHCLFAEPPWAFLAWPAAAMIVATVVGRLLGKASHAFAIVPRTPGGLVGIVTGPFLHANAAHLLANLPPFLVLGALALRRGTGRFVETVAVVAVGSGALVWLLGRRGAHMGASGVVFGLFGYLVGLAYFTRRTSDLLVAAIVLLVYGGILAGLRPARSNASWEAHLFGLLVGIGKVWVLGR